MFLSIFEAEVPHFTQCEILEPWQRSSVGKEISPSQGPCCLVPPASSFPPPHAVVEHPAFSRGSLPTVLSVLHSIVAARPLPELRTTPPNSR